MSTHRYRVGQELTFCRSSNPQSFFPTAFERYLGTTVQVSRLLSKSPFGDEPAYEVQSYEDGSWFGVAEGSLKPKQPPLGHWQAIADLGWVPPTRRQTTSNKGAS